MTINKRGSPLARLTHILDELSTRPRGLVPLTGELVRELEVLLVGVGASVVEHKGSPHTEWAQVRNYVHPLVKRGGWVLNARYIRGDAGLVVASLDQPLLRELVRRLSDEPD